MTRILVVDVKKKSQKIKNKKKNLLEEIRGTHHMSDSNVGSVLTPEIGSLPLFFWPIVLGHHKVTRNIRPEIIHVHQSCLQLERRPAGICIG